MLRAAHRVCVGCARGPEARGARGLTHDAHNRVQPHRLRLRGPMGHIILYSNRSGSLTQTPTHVPRPSLPTPPAYTAWPHIDFFHSTPLLSPSLNTLLHPPLHRLTQPPSGHTPCPSPRLPRRTTPHILCPYVLHAHFPSQLTPNSTPVFRRTNTSSWLYLTTAPRASGIPPQPDHKCH